MAHYAVRLTRTVTDILEATVNIEAASEEEARAMAVSLAQNDEDGDVGWAFYVEADSDPTNIEADSVTLRPVSNP